MATFYDVLLSFLSNRIAQDRIWKACQYSIRLYSLSRAKEHQKPILSDFGSKFNYARLLLRVGDVLEDVSDTKDAVTEARISKTPASHFLSILEPATNALSDFFDFLCLVFDCLNLEDHSTAADYWSSLIGLVGNFMDSFRGLKTIMKCWTKLSQNPTVDLRKKLQFKLFIRGYLCFLKGLADAILSLSSIIPRLEEMRVLVAISGFLGGTTGLFLSYYSLLKEETVEIQ